MTVILAQFKIWSVLPDNLVASLKKFNFHSWDITGLKQRLDHAPAKEKNILLASVNTYVLKSTNIFLESPYYLLGLMSLFETTDRVSDFLWGKFVIALQPRQNHSHQTTDIYLAVDFTVKPFVRLTTAYATSIEEENALLLLQL